MKPKALPHTKPDAALADDAFELETFEEAASRPKTNRLRNHGGTLCDSQGYNIGIRIGEQV